MNFSDDELLKLPEDPELAFVQYEQNLRKCIEQAIEQSGGYGIDSLRVEYINQVLGMVNALDLDILSNWTFSTGNQNSDAIEADYRQMLAETTYYVAQIRVRHARRVKQYSIPLDAAAKQRIRHHLTKIKEMVDKLEVPERKREKLYDKVAALENEVDRERTRIDAAMDLGLELADVGGEMGKRLKPLREVFDSITGVLKAAQDLAESLPKLAGPNEPKRIEGPKSEPDDDVPF